MRVMARKIYRMHEAEKFCKDNRRTLFGAPETRNFKFWIISRDIT